MASGFGSVLPDEVRASSVRASSARASSARASGSPPAKGQGTATDRGHASDFRAVAAFREVAAAMAEELDLETVLHLIVTKLSELTGAGRCSMHLRDEETGLFHGQVAHASSNIDIEVKELISGLPGDGFTQEILLTRLPVALVNTMTDPRAVRSAMRKWRVSSVLGVPMILREKVIGILCLDSEDVAREFTAEEQELAAAFAELAAIAVNQVKLTSQLRMSLASEETHIKLLQQATWMERQLADLILGGGGNRDLAETISRLLSKPCAIYDENFRSLASFTPPEDHNLGPAKLLDANLRSDPDILASLDKLVPGQPELIGPLPRAGLHHRLLVGLVARDTERWGYVVVAEQPGRFGVIDKTIVRRASQNIAIESSRRHRSHDIEWHAVEAFTGSLIRGENVSIEARGEVLGIRLDARRVVCLIATHDPAGVVTISPRAAARMLTSTESPSAVIATPSANGIALIIELPTRRSDSDAIGALRDRLSLFLDQLDFSGSLHAAISSVISAPGADVTAHTEANQVLACMRSHVLTPGNHVLALSDLGAGRLLLASADREGAQRFARDALGPLMASPNTKSEELLVTLNAFLQSGRSVSRSAHFLGVHPNTIRYRLSSISKLTGLSIATDDDAYMTAQIALLVLRLSGRLPLVRQLTSAHGAPDSSDVSESDLSESDLSESDVEFERG
ncbi:hypothetical protein BH09ACT6_BH09ACT6_07090 [soil metagenome]